MRDKVRAVVLILAYVATAGAAAAQSDALQRPCDLPEGKQFDFWLGEWELSWPAEQSGGSAGGTARGTNSVRRILDGCIIEEAFRFPGGQLEGRSVSAYDARARVWRQTWVDNRGNYLTFSGVFRDGAMELRTAPYEREGAVYISRMVFRNISRDSFDWDWQRSRDGGATWQDLWNIHYERSPARR